MMQEDEEAEACLPASTAAAADALEGSWTDAAGRAAGRSKNSSAAGMTQLSAN